MDQQPRPAQNKMFNCHNSHMETSVYVRGRPFSGSLSVMAFTIASTSGFHDFLRSLCDCFTALLSLCRPGGARLATSTQNISSSSLLQTLPPMIAVVDVVVLVELSTGSRSVSPLRVGNEDASGVVRSNRAMLWEEKSLKELVA